MSVYDMLLFLPAAILMAIPLGPSNFLSFSNALQHGAVPAGIAGLARIAGFGLLIVITAFGLGAVLAEAAWLLIGIKWFGVAYLAWLGWRLLRAPAPDLAAARRTRASVPLRTLMRQEFTTALANPKAILYFTAAFPQFIGHADNFTLRFLVMGAIYLVCEYAALWGYALIGSGLGHSGVLDRAKAWVNRVTGISFFGFAGWMASSGS
ncbi:LysE family translocator [Pararhodospirillum photometricum]|uniref:Lysine exporter protein (LYSE/YGGA) n=1 Tax=Pararhodospirillum photometricum DSM 122 TaxID=1150469 RepID=H6SQT4_PARPM|nr:LysE family translocator [Pararhodospirillum photometricum]CCG07399.1 Lysine exporter protein (LYSE/YGGA) [Pararhodospirillum photometricum DSM 122]